jgi:hypothetical protein
MNAKASKEDRTVIRSDKYLSESGVQGGKIIGEHLALGSFIFGASFFIIGLFSLCYMVFVIGYSRDMPLILIFLSPQSLATMIGLLLLIGGFFVYKDKHRKKVAEKH